MNRRLIVYLGMTALMLVGSVGYVVQDLRRVQHLTMAAGDRTGGSYLFSKNFSDIYNKYGTRAKIDILVTKGSVQNLELLSENRVQLATAQSDTISTPSTALIAYLFPDRYQLVVTEKSGIKKVAELKGKRVALQPEGSGHYKNFWILASHYGLSQRDIKYKVMSESDANLAFSRNQVDAIFRTRILGNQDIKELVQKYRGQLVPIDQGAAMQIDTPSLSTSIIPKGAYQGNPPIPPEDLPTVSLERNFLANKSLDAETVREITQVLFEHQSELAAKMPIAASISEPKQNSKVAYNLHPGAQAYYNRDKPSFIQEHADYVGLLVTVAMLIGSWFLGLKNSWDKAKKNRADVYNQEIVDLIFSTQESEDLSEVIEIRRKLNEIFREVVSDLDKDKISAESFESFSFAWQAAISSVRDRENVLRSEFNYRSFE